MEEYETFQAKLKSLLKKEKSSKVRVEENKNRYEIAKSIFSKENEDVEKLQSESLSSFLKRLVGNYANQLDKEMQEQLTAKIELDLSLALLLESRDNLSTIQSILDQTATQMKQLKERLSFQDEHFREKITAEEMRRAQLKQELIELDEASTAGDNLLEGIRSAQVDLNSADSFSTWDLFGGSFIIDMLKYNKIDNAEAKISRLELLLENYTKELKDLSLDPYLNYETFSSTSRTFDIFFDNIFSDWNTKEKIARNIDSLKTLRNSIIDVQDNLEVNRQELQDQIEESNLLF